MSMARYAFCRWPPESVPQPARSTVLHARQLQGTFHGFLVGRAQAVGKAEVGKAGRG